MERIKDTIETIIRDLTSKKTPGRQDGPEEWLKKTLTKKELGHIKFQYFKKGVLGVRVDSSVWKYNLSLKRDQLLKRIQGYNTKVKDVHLIVGDIG